MWVRLSRSCRSGCCGFSTARFAVGLRIAFVGDSIGLTRTGCRMKAFGACAGPSPDLGIDASLVVQSLLAGLPSVSTVVALASLALPGSSNLGLVEVALSLLRGKVDLVLLALARRVDCIDALPARITGYGLTSPAISSPRATSGRMVHTHSSSFSFDPSGPSAKAKV